MSVGVDWHFIPANSNSDKTIARGNKTFISFATDHLEFTSVVQTFTLLTLNEELCLFSDAGSYNVKIATEKLKNVF